MKTSTAIFGVLGVVVLGFCLTFVVRTVQQIERVSDSVYVQVADSLATQTGDSLAAEAAKLPGITETLVKGFAMLFLLLGLYFLPTIFAVRRRHPNKQPIVLLNIFMGWTLIGWFVALLWSLAAINPVLIPADQPGPSTSRFCGACGARAVSGAFCRECGSRI